MMENENKKQKIDEVKRGDVYRYWIKKYEVVGTEIKKTKRLGVIVSTNDLNSLNDRFIIVPLTSKKTNRLYSYEVPVKFDNKLGKALLDQVKTISKVRLLEKMGELTESEAEEINDKLLSVLGLWDHLLKKVGN